MLWCERDIGLLDLVGLTCDLSVVVVVILMVVVVAVVVIVVVSGWVGVSRACHCKKQERRKNGESQTFVDYHYRKHHNCRGQGNQKELRKKLPSS